MSPKGSDGRFDSIGGLLFVLIWCYAILSPFIQIVVWARVAEWPVIGTRVFEQWSAAAADLEATLNQFGPVAVWVFSVADPLPATIFLVYSIMVGFSDAVLKPLLLGRGVEVPMLVILLGAIGGAILDGPIGLFVGAVVLAVGYQLLMAWLAMGQQEEEAVESS